MKLLYSIIFLFVSTSLVAQFKKVENVSIDELLVDTQFNKDDANSLTMIWWIPFEFWEVSYAQDDASAQSEIDALKEILEGYEIIAVVKGDIGHFGGINYEPKEEILEQIKVIYQEETLNQVEIKELSSDLKNFMGMMQPMMANMFGEMGENMHFVVLENNKINAVLPIDPKGEAPVTFLLDDFTTTVSLPLKSLLKEKKCPKDGVLHSGKWNYCPMHGDALIAQ